jgi:hypothetical protein
MEASDLSVILLSYRSCRVDLVCHPVARCDAPGTAHQPFEPVSIFSALMASRPDPGTPYSIPGAFIAQIAAINRPFARGRMVIVSAKALNGHIAMLTKSGH